MTAARFTITGKVQGVGYRWWAVGQARRLALRGWVRNRHDGSVELLAIGEEKSLARLEAACREGPPGSMVREVAVAPAEDDGSLDFRQAPTA